MMAEVIHTQPLAPRVPTPLRATTSNLILLSALGVVMGVAFAFGINIVRPVVDNTALIVIVFAFIGTATTQVYGILKSADVLVKTGETHDMVNGQMDAYKTTIHAEVKAQLAARSAEAFQAGQAHAEARTDKLADDAKTAAVVPPAAGGTP